MPNITAPAAFGYDGGSIRSTRIKPGMFRFRASTSLVSSKDSVVTADVAIPQLDRLRRFDKLMRGDEVDPRFQIIWQRTMEAIEAAFEAVNARVDEVAILARLSAVEVKAEVANDNAVKAQAEVEIVQQAAGNTFNVSDPTLANQYQEELDRLRLERGFDIGNF